VALKQNDFSADLCAQLVEQYGTIELAAKAIAPDCETRLGGIPSYNTIKAWISAHVGPMRRMRAALREANDGQGLDLSRPADPERINRIDDLLDRANVPLEAVGSIISTKLKAYSGFLKNAEGEPVRVPMYSTSVTIAPEPKALIAEPFASIVKAYKLTGVRSSDTQRIFIVGDLQIGFWAVRDPNDSQKFTFEPFHDESAIDIMMKAMALYAPSVVVIVGDFFDFPQLSRFQQEPEARNTMQATVDYGEALIAKIRKTVGLDCTIIFVPGNHETRMTRAIVNNIEALYNLTRPGEKHALYSIPSLLRFEDHNVDCMAEFPSGQYWLAKRRGNIPGLVVTHADPKKKDMRADSIHGHLVLPAIETFAREYEDGWVTYQRMCVSGCANYSDTGDKVRLTRTNAPSGRSRMASVQSFGTVDIDAESGQRAQHLHLIRDGATLFLGRVIRSNEKAAA